MPTLHVGKKRIQTLAGSDGSVIPPGSVSVTVAPGGFVNASVDPATNNVTVNGVGVGTATVTYAANGYQSAMQTFDVSPAPSIVVTDGPEV